MRVTPEQRKQWIGEFPRIKYLPDSKEQCDYFRSKGRCKLRAVFRFKSLKRSWAKDGMYCWTHLSMQLEEPLEGAAVKEWSEKHVPEWEADWKLDEAEREEAMTK